MPSFLGDIQQVAGTSQTGLQDLLPDLEEPLILANAVHRCSVEIGYSCGLAGCVKESVYLATGPIVME